MSAAQIVNFTIAANLIEVDTSARNLITTLTIFYPDNDTVGRLCRLGKNDILDGIILKDVFENGMIDIRENHHQFEVISCFVSDPRKSRTVTLVLIDYDEMIRKRSYANNC